MYFSTYKNKISYLNQWCILRSPCTLILNFKWSLVYIKTLIFPPPWLINIFGTIYRIIYGCRPRQMAPEKPSNSFSRCCRGHPLFSPLASFYETIIYGQDVFYLFRRLTTETMEKIWSFYLLPEKALYSKFGSSRQWLMGSRLAQKPSLFCSLVVR